MHVYVCVHDRGCNAHFCGDITNMELETVKDVFIKTSFHLRQSTVITAYNEC